MNGNTEIDVRGASGRFLIWEPDLKSPDRHQLLDSDRPSTTYFKKGRLKINGGTVALEKNRHFVRALAFLLCMPLWGGLAMLLGALALAPFGASGNHYLGLVMLGSLAITITACAIMICRLIKPIQREYALVQIANVQLKDLQVTRNNLPISAGRLGVDFCVIPPDLMDAKGRLNDPLKGAVAQRCSFVTFIAEAQSEASKLQQWLPTQQVPLTGKRDPNIPPQQSVPWVGASIPVVQDLPGANPLAAQVQQRYRHNANPWGVLFLALLFGVVALCIAHAAVTNHQGLIINGIIRLGPTGATMFYALTAILAAAGFLLMAAGALQSFFNPHQLEIRSDAIVFWGGWLKLKPAALPFAAIQSIGQQQSIKGGARTMILVANNHQFQVQESLLPNRQAYDTIHAFIVRGQQRASGSTSQSATRTTPSASKPAPTPPPEDDSRFMPPE